MATNQPFRLGSISTGTLRTEDLLESFTATLNRLDNTNPLIAEALDLIASDDWTEEQQEAASYMVNETLIDAIQTHCPRFVFFGAHPGDGADFGFWVDLDALQDAMPNQSN